ncbi:MAG TPA: hypothetical protein VLE96_02780 [Chlamydiales bacterium]|nr:hypothetical protein [Chlamydiales bacterium]
MTFCKRWFFVFAFCLVTSFIYSKAVKKKRNIYSEYTALLQEMEKAKCLATLEKEYLELKIASQDDPAWIEMILMRDLGVVPEGYLKVHFTGS